LTRDELGEEQSARPASRVVEVFLSEDGDVVQPSVIVSFSRSLPANASKAEPVAARHPSSDSSPRTRMHLRPRRALSSMVARRRVTPVTARYRVVLLPGGVLPAEPAYAALLQVLGARVDAVAKDLAVYSGEQPPPDFSLGTEVEGILRDADGHGFDRFHLVGYSGGGASSLAFAALHGERLLSLALLEPAWAGNERTPVEEALMQRFRALEPLPPDQFMAGFMRLQLAPGVEPPPPPEGPPPPWMAKRPAGLRAFIEAFDSGDLDVEALRAFNRPVYFALGGRSNPDYYGRMAERLAAIFPDFTIETFPERHHFDPPHRVEPERLASSLLALWQRAESVSS
jgi:pimeloyl-ACP methyl ester carboxylesterase